MRVASNITQNITWVFVGAALCVSAAACDERVEVRNQAPAATPLALCADGDRLFFVVDVYDREGDPVDLAWVVDGARAAPGAAGDGLFGLVSERRSPGERHLVEWGSAADDCDSAFPDIDGTKGCTLAPATHPTTVSGQVFASDRELQAEATFELTLGVGCDTLL